MPCRWASEAVASFKDLAEHFRLNLEYAADQRQAQAQAARCAILML